MAENTALSVEDALAAAEAVVAGAGDDPAEIVRALDAAGFLATHHERGVACSDPSCHPADEPLEPCSWSDADDRLVARPGDRIFTRFTARWTEEV